MSITFNCSCGATLTVPDEMAGRTALCPACNKVVPIPVKAILVKPPEGEKGPAPPPRAEAAEGASPAGKPIGSAAANISEGGSSPSRPEASRSEEGTPAAERAPSPAAQAVQAGSQPQPPGVQAEDDLKLSPPPPGSPAPAAPGEGRDGKSSQDSKMVPLLFGELASPPADAAPKEARAAGGRPGKSGRGAVMPEADQIKLDGEDEPDDEEHAHQPAGGTPARPDASPSASPGVEKEKPIAPAHVQEVKTPDGKTTYKLTCVCGKRMLIPPGVKRRTGRCPKCNKLIRLPRTEASAPRGVEEAIERKADIPKGSKAGGSLEPVLSPSRPPEHQKQGNGGYTNRDAAMAAAERLRSRASERMQASAGGAVVEAWPRADLTLRGLAVFIDITAVMLAIGIVLLLATQKILPEWMTRMSATLALFAALTILNDAGLQLLFGGSLGKRLVILTLLASDGRPPAAPKVLLRAVLKWVLLPGWILFFFDPDRRAVHDVICGTLVLKGRKR
jgi:uncharacterized RDD family membrane protein YckC